MTANTKRILLIISLILTGVVLVGLLGTLMWLQLQRPTLAAPTVLPTETTLPIQATTEATTLPPPPANVFDPADFVFDENGYLTCTAGAYERGIDVSAYQGKIDWKKVAKSGVTFAIIRVAGRGYGEAGTLYDDKLAQDNYKAAKKAGLKIGAYFFSQAITPEEAIEEAEYLLEKTQDWDLEMPLVYDWEYISEEARTGNIDQQTLTDCIIAFCQRIEQAGKEPMVYFSPNQAQKLFYLEQLVDYPFWVAMYTDWMTFPYQFNMWQYTNEGKVPGVNGNVDINLLFRYENE